MKNIFLAISLLLITLKVVMADIVNLAYMKMPKKDNTVRIYGKVLEKVPKDCKTGVALVFINKKGFRNIYIGSDISFKELKSMNFLQIYMPGDKKVIMCIFEKIFEINTSVKYQTRIMQSIFLWSSQKEFLVKQRHVNDLEKI